MEYLQRAQEAIYDDLIDRCRVFGNEIGSAKEKQKVPDWIDVEFENTISKMSRMKLDDEKIQTTRDFYHYSIQKHQVLLTKLEEHQKWCISILKSVKSETNNVMTKNTWNGLQLTELFTSIKKKNDLKQNAIIEYRNNFNISPYDNPTLIEITTPFDSLTNEYILCEIELFHTQKERFQKMILDKISVLKSVNNSVDLNKKYDEIMTRLSIKDEISLVEYHQAIVKLNKFNKCKSDRIRVDLQEIRDRYLNLLNGDVEYEFLYKFVCEVNLYISKWMMSEIPLNFTALASDQFKKNGIKSEKMMKFSMDKVLVYIEDMIHGLVSNVGLMSSKAIKLEHTIAKIKKAYLERLDLLKSAHIEFCALQSKFIHPFLGKLVFNDEKHSSIEFSPLDFGQVPLSILDLKNVFQGIAINFEKPIDTSMIHDTSFIAMDPSNDIMDEVKTTIWSPFIIFSQDITTEQEFVQNIKEFMEIFYCSLLQEHISRIDSETNWSLLSHDAKMKILTNGEAEDSIILKSKSFEKDGKGVELILDCKEFGGVFLKNFDLVYLDLINSKSNILNIESILYFKE